MVHGRRRASATSTSPSQLVNVNIGYQHPRWSRAIQEQAGRLCTIAPSFANDARSEAARLIAELAPGDLDTVFFTNGGAEATENAMRMARLHTGRHKVLAAYRSYHGATAGAIALTGDPRRWASEPGIPGIVRYWGPYLYRSAFHATHRGEECERALAAPARPGHGRGPGARSPRSSSRPSSAPTASSSRPRLPRGRARAVRRARHRDDRRRGDGRLRPLRRVVRGRPLGRHARPDHLRQGRQLRLRAARRRDHLRRDRRDVRRAVPTPAASPTPATRSRAPPRSRPSRSSRTRASSRTRRQLGADVHRPRTGEDRRAAPVASARCAGSAASGRVELVRDRETREPLVPFNASGADAAPMDEVVAACQAAGSGRSCTSTAST